MMGTAKDNGKLVDTVTEGMRADARAIYQAGLRAVAPGDAVRRNCRLQGESLQAGGRTYDLARMRRIIVVGAGKATAAMAQAIEALLGDRIHDGLISVKYDHGAPLQHIRIMEAGHPLPDSQGVEAAREILTLAQQATSDDLVIVLLSGGGSSLLPLPAEGISLQDKQATSDVLISCGATIHEINTLRKHISTIKGGRLARAAAPAAMLTLILSDVVGDDLDVIASGPTVPDASSFADCLAILARYDLDRRIPQSVRHLLQQGADGILAETPKPGIHGWNHVHNLIVGNNSAAIQAAAAEARERGYHTLILSSRMEGETRVVAQVHGAVAREILCSGHPLQPPACLLSGGETTVTLKGDGLGGRNQEFALAAALDIDKAARIVVLSGGTDGTDGPTDAAGAIADHTTVQRASALGLDTRSHLRNNDAYPYFKQLNDLLITGPTHTNVMDLHVVLVRTGASHLCNSGPANADKPLSEKNPP